MRSIQSETQEATNSVSKSSRKLLRGPLVDNPRCDLQHRYKHANDADFGSLVMDRQTRKLLKKSCWNDAVLNRV